METLETQTEETVSKFEEFIDGNFSALESSIYEIYADNVGEDLEEIEDWHDTCEEAYIGQFWSDEEMAEECYGDTLNIPAHLTKYINWEAFARDLMYDHFEVEGYYFRNL